MGLLILYLAGVNPFPSFLYCHFSFSFFFFFCCQENYGHNLEDNGCSTWIISVYILWIWLSISVGCYLYSNCMTPLDDLHQLTSGLPDQHFCISAVLVAPHRSSLVFIATRTDSLCCDRKRYLHIQVFCPLLINEPILTLPTGLYINMFNKARWCIYTVCSSLPLCM